MTFLSIYDAQRLSQLLENETIKLVQSKFEDRLDERVAAIQKGHVSDAIKHDLRMLAVKIHKRPASSPSTRRPRTQPTASRPRPSPHDFKELLKRLAANLKEKA